MIQRFAFLVSILFAPAFVLAQEPAPDLKDFSPETRKSYAETQKFIDQTESKMKLVRAQTDARAKEIEILANRVGKIISRMSSQGEDNSALQSEISVLNELLNLERQTTGDLRKENTRLTTAVDILKKERIGYEKLQIEKLRLKETELAGAQKRLNAALDSATTREKTNKVLLTNVEALTKEKDRLTKQVKLLKENRYRPKRRFSTPK